MSFPHCAPSRPDRSASPASATNSTPRRRIRPQLGRVAWRDVEWGASRAGEYSVLYGQCAACPTARRHRNPCSCTSSIRSAFSGYFVRVRSCMTSGRAFASGARRFVFRRAARCGRARRGHAACRVVHRRRRRDRHAHAKCRVARRRTHARDTRAALLRADEGANANQRPRVRAAAVG